METPIERVQRLALFEIENYGETCTANIIVIGAEPGWCLSPKAWVQVVRDGFAQMLDEQRIVSDERGPEIWYGYPDLLQRIVTAVEDSEA